MRDVVDTVRDQSDARTKITITKKSTSGDAFGLAFGQQDSHLFYRYSYRH